MLQGIADCIFFEGDSAVLIDYKTDRVRAAQVLVQRYGAQLRLYADAYFRMTGQPVAKAVIYSFALGCDIEVPLEKKTFSV